MRPFFCQISLSITLLLLCAFSAEAQWQLDIESGAVWNGRNDVRVPNGGTPFSLTENNQTAATPFFRAELLYTFNTRHTIRALYAPFQINSTGTFGRDVTFNDIVFPEGTLYHGNYVFNSYRLTYRYDFLTTTASCGLPLQEKTSPFPGVSGQGLWSIAIWNIWQGCITSSRGIWASAPITTAIWGLG